MIIGNIHCSQLFHVVKKLKPECLLGRDFLRQYECVLDFTTHTLRSTKLAQLRVDSTVMIPPRATSICHADISDNRHFITGTVMEVFAKPLPHQLKTTPSLSKVSRNKLTVQIFNNSDREVTLKRYTLVAVARPISHTADIYKVNVVSQPPQVPPHGKSYDTSAPIHTFTAEATSNGSSTTARKPSVYTIPLSS